MMKYIFEFDQNKLMECSAEEEKINTKDIIFLHYLVNAIISDNIIYTWENNKKLVWLKRDKIMADLPILGYKCANDITKLYIHLKKLGLVTTTKVSNNNIKGSKSYIGITTKLLEIINCDSSVMEKLQKKCGYNDEDHTSELECGDTNIILSHSNSEVSDNTLERRYNNILEKTSAEPTSSLKQSKSLENKTKPKRNYLSKPLLNMEVSEKAKKKLPIQKSMDVLDIYKLSDKVFMALCDYLEMKNSMAFTDKKYLLSVASTKSLIEKKILPYLEKYSEKDVIEFIRNATSEKWASVFAKSTNTTYKTNFNDSEDYTEEEIRKAEEEGKRAIERAKKNGTFKLEF